MKANHKARTTAQRGEPKHLTLGELIASTYNACGAQGAPKILQLALESQLVRLAPRAHAHF